MPLDLPELLRIKATTLLALPARDESAAETCLNSSLACAQHQSALSWELRTTMALMRLRAQRGASAPARETLAAVYERFTGGFETTDLKAARQLLDSTHIASVSR